jgi:hypothetical protein
LVRLTVNKCAPAGDFVASNRSWTRRGHRMDAESLQK